VQQASETAYIKMAEERRNAQNIGIIPITWKNEKIVREYLAQTHMANIS
jgi:hypothetical protein